MHGCSLTQRDVQQRDHVAGPRFGTWHDDAVVLNGAGSKKRSGDLFIRDAEWMFG